MDTGINFKTLRKKLRLSQEEFAFAVGVSKQAVQKWENGVCLPDADHLAVIKAKYNVSIDGLLFGNENEVKEIRVLPAHPDYSARSIWDEYSKNLLIEYKQSYDEGKDVERYKVLTEEIDGMADGREKHDMADCIYRLFLSANERAGYAYVEPDTYGEILACCEAPQKTNTAKASRRKIAGAWWGRIAGCMLGKPVEGVRRDNIVKMLASCGNLPIHRYIKKSDVREDVPISDCYCIDAVAGAALADDDTNYTVLAQRIIDMHGKDFTSENVMAAWCDLQPRSAYCTAERVAINNWYNGYVPPVTAVRKNAYREWIGAQIRADYYGYIYPGNPLAAASAAYRDARISHVKNGIYGSMYFAAAIALAAAETDIVTVLEKALRYVPRESRFYENIAGVLADYKKGVGADASFEKTFALFDETDVHGWTHTLSNARLTVAALLYGDGNFVKTVGYCAAAGFDTDCNGATAGSVFGMLHGIESIPTQWYAPFCGKLWTDIRGCGVTDVETLIDKTVQHVDLCAENENTARSRL